MPLRARRRRTRALVAVGVLLALVIGAWGVSLVSYLPRFSVSSIDVEGAQVVQPELIRSYAETVLDDGSFHWLSRSNIFLYPRVEIEKAIPENFPRIESAHISRESFLATVVKITVKERTMYGIWCDEEKRCYEMDETGFIFSETPYTTSTRYVFTGGIPTSSDPIGQSFIKAHLPGLLSLLRLLGQAGYEPRGAAVVSSQDFHVSLASGFMLKVSFGGDANALARNLELVLSSDTLKDKKDQIEYIDLRFGNRVYYKLKGEEEVSS